MQFIILIFDQIINSTLTFVISKCGRCWRHREHVVKKGLAHAFWHRSTTSAIGDQLVTACGGWHARHRATTAPSRTSFRTHRGRVSKKSRQGFTPSFGRKPFHKVQVLHRPLCVEQSFVRIKSKLIYYRKLKKTTSVATRRHQTFAVKQQASVSENYNTWIIRENKS